MIGREKPGEQSEVAQLIQQTLEQERWQREMMEQRYNQYMDEQEVSVNRCTGSCACCVSLKKKKKKPCGGATSARAQCRRDGAVLTNQFPSPPKHTESHDHTTNTFLRSEREVQAANYRQNVKHGV